MVESFETVTYKEAIDLLLARATVYVFSHHHRHYSTDYRSSGGRSSSLSINQQTGEENNSETAPANFLNAFEKIIELVF